MDDDRYSRWYRHGFYRAESVAEALLRASRQSPATPFRFYVDGQVQETTVGALCAQGRSAAAALQDSGVRVGDVMAIQLPSRPETAVLYVAAFHAGASVLPIVHTYGPAEVDFILADSRARWLAIPDAWRGVDYLGRCAQMPAAQALRGILVLEGRGGTAATIRRAARRTQGDEREGRAPRTISLDDLLASNLPDRAPPPQRADDDCVLLYTSGTTSRPKGVRHTHNTIRSEWEIPFLANAGPYLTPFPAGHIAGFNFMLRPMVCRVPMVFMDRWDADAAAELAQRYRVTQSGGTPYFMTSLLEAAERGCRDLSSIVAYSLGATGVTPEHVRRTDELGWRGGRSYGMTEHSTITRTDPEMPFERRAFTDGRLQPGTEMRVVDDGGGDLPPGSEGELLVRGPETFVGYTDAEATRMAFVGDGWFRTGDVGTCDAEGFVTITDRRKDIIIRGGEKIASREIEELLARHPAIADVAAVAMPDTRLGEKVGVYVVTRAGQSIDREALERHCLEAGLARFKVPEHLHVVNELPRNAAGKVRKDELRRRARES